MNDAPRAEELRRRLEAFGAPRALVLGDAMLDRYLHGEVERLSPEAPIPVLGVREGRFLPGGAANVAANLAALGARVALVGLAGRDPAGAELELALRGAGVGTAGLVFLAGRATTVKTRLLARSQQILRLDSETTAPPPPAALAALARRLRVPLASCAVALVSDYAKGVVQPALFARLAAGCARRRVPLLVDPKGRDWRRYRGAFLLKANRRETEEATGIALGDEAARARAARAVFAAVAKLEVFVLTGAEGIRIYPRRGRPLFFPGRPRQVYDVTGAGDTVLAVLGLVLGAGGSLAEAGALAVAAAGVAVGRLGAAAVSRAELAAELAPAAGSHPKILAPAVLAAVIAAARRAGRRVVFTNGCFDLLHPGHVDLLARARALGDVLVVGVNSDRSVRALKGPGRPVQPLADRQRVLAALADVDYVTFFAEPTPAALVRRLGPDVLVKGEDWRTKGVVGREFVERRGGKVVLVPLVPGRSTSALLARAARPPAAARRPARGRG